MSTILISHFVYIYFNTGASFSAIFCLNIDWNVKSLEVFLILKVWFYNDFSHFLKVFFFILPLKKSSFELLKIRDMVVIFDRCYHSHYNCNLVECKRLKPVDHLSTSQKLGRFYRCDVLWPPEKSRKWIFFPKPSPTSPLYISPKPNISRRLHISY